MNIELKGRIALVTGGTGQLGRVICRTLGACGADIVIHYHQNREQALSLHRELLTMGVRCLIVGADITDGASIEVMRIKIEKEIGKPDIIVNNAVVQYPWKTILEQNIADYESQFRSCVLQNVLMAKAFVPSMIQKRYGRVIAVNTECAMLNGPGQSAYVAGKRGMDGVLRVLAREIGEHQITVNQVAPGWMISENVKDNDSQWERAYRMNIPLKRRGHAQDVANLVAFLASDLAGFITGQYISVSGGNVMPAI